MATATADYNVRIVADTTAFHTQLDEIEARVEHLIELVERLREASNGEDES